MQFKCWSDTFLLPTMSCHMNPYRSGKLTVQVGASGTAECIQMSVHFFKLRAVFKSKLLFKQIMNQAEDALFPQVGWNHDLKILKYELNDSNVRHRLLDIHLWH